MPPGNYSNEERLTGSALAQLNFSGIESLLSDGLHESIDQLQRKLIDVGQKYFLKPMSYYHLKLKTPPLLQWFNDKCSSSS